jgi:uncharacterized membrane protein
MPAWAGAALPIAALALSILVVLFLWIRMLRAPDALTGESLARARPVLAALLVVAALPALYAGLVWSLALPETFARIERPAVTLAGLAAGAVVARRLARWGRGRSRRRVLAVDALAALAVLSGALAAAGLSIGRPLDRLAVLVAIDRSRSIDLVPAADERVARELQVAEAGMREGDRLGTVAFAATAQVEQAPRSKTTLPTPQEVSLGRDATDLAAAIRRALAEVPEGTAARVAVVSDGVATRGDAEAAAAAALAAGVPIDVVVLEQRRVPDVRLVSLRAPPRTAKGEAFDLRLVTSSEVAAEVEIRIYRDGESVGSSRARLAAGEDVLRVRRVEDESGLHRYDVEITAIDPVLDGAAEDNRASAFVRVRGQAAALVLDLEPEQTAFVARALEGASFRVERGGVAAAPADLGALSAYDVVVLGDLPAPELSSGQIEALASYVRDLGGGIVLLGGDRSLGPGGYGKTPLEEISPVSFDLKQERRRASLAEVIGIDISGSMAMPVGARTKLELANEAAARAAALLGPGDRLGVLHVDTVARWSVPLGPVQDAEREATDRAIRAVAPGGGGIFVDVAVAEAYRALRADDASLKHLLLFADGADAEEMNGAHRMAREAHAGGVTTSVIALGAGQDVPALERLSREGGGRFYLIHDAARLPQVFAQETVLAARSAIVEEPFRPTLGAPGAPVLGIAWGEAPALGGYVVTIAKSRATVLLGAPEGDPLLATWSAGLGRAAAFTSDLSGRWGAAWTQWPGAARMIAQLARDVARKDDDPRVRLEAEAKGGELHVRASVAAEDGRGDPFRRLEARVAGPDGFTRTAPLEPVAAGAYAATIPLSRPGSYVAVARDELSGEVVGTAGAALGPGDELRPTGSDAGALLRLAELTTGKRRDTLAGIFDDRGPRRFAHDDATRPLLGLCAAALLLSIAARRLAVPEAVERTLARLRALDRAAARGAQGVPPAGSAVGVLLRAKRARMEMKDDDAGAPPRPIAPADRPPAPPWIAPPAAPPKAPPVAPAAAPPSGVTPSSAEILAARRRAKR